MLDDGVFGACNWLGKGLILGISGVFWERLYMLGRNQYMLITGFDCIGYLQSQLQRCQCNTVIGHTAASVKLTTSLFRTGQGVGVGVSPQILRGTIFFFLIFSFPLHRFLCSSVPYQDSQWFKGFRYWVNSNADWLTANSKAVLIKRPLSYFPPIHCSSNFLLKFWVMDFEVLPGTGRLLNEDQQNRLPASQRLQTHGDIVLQPQPTDSPNDPLLWWVSRWSLHVVRSHLKELAGWLLTSNRSPLRKYWHAFLVCFVTALTAATSNDAGSAQDGMNTDLGISWGSMSTAVGVLFLGIGYWTLLISPAAWLYGRRITYLICILLGLGGAIWMARVKTAQDSIWNQLFVGASEACAEANVSWIQERQSIRRRRFRNLKMLDMKESPEVSREDYLKAFHIFLK